jgi:hypothetical protein
MAVFYNQIIRKTTVAFGNLFNNITLVRYNPDGSEAERFLVPISFAGKERYAVRLEEDPNLDKKIQMTLPRMSFEMTGLNYDASRKQQTLIQNFAQSNTGAIQSQYIPVPYDFKFSLYVYVRNIEDGNQIIEHILPYFSPDYTIKLNMIPEMGIIKELPIVLNDTQYEVEYEGPRSNDTRVVTWTLNFTIKGYVFGPVTASGLITSAITTILENNNLGQQYVDLSMSSGFGTYQQGETVYQGYSLNTSVASARVISWSNNILRISNITGNFTVGQPVIGATTNANYGFNTYKIVPQKDFQSIITPNPSSANANSNYTYTVSTTEYPNVP